jgi:methylthioribose-1-phosphate isomerase
MGSRPTAVDLGNAIKLLKTVADAAAATPGASAAAVRTAYIEAAEKILEDDLTTNLAIGRYGAEYLRRQQMPIMNSIDPADSLRYFTTSPPGTQGAPDRSYRKLSVLTHCNTGFVHHGHTSTNFANGRTQFSCYVRSWYCFGHNPLAPPHELPPPCLLHGDAPLQPRFPSHSL